MLNYTPQLQMMEDNLRALLKYSKFLIGQIKMLLGCINATDITHTAFYLLHIRPKFLLSTLCFITFKNFGNDF